MKHAFVAHCIGVEVRIAIANPQTRAAVRNAIHGSSAQLKVAEANQPYARPLPRRYLVPLPCASSPCSVINDCISCSSLLEHTPSRTTSSQPSAAT